jgi:hypothetical protein
MTRTKEYSMIACLEVQGLVVRMLSHGMESRTFWSGRLYHDSPQLRKYYKQHLMMSSLLQTKGDDHKIKSIEKSCI